jgi:2-polyprenyl-3-methyl-5-hydroxy-6-metoxy-1,4-benzoquinol methylase
MSAVDAASANRVRVGAWWKRYVDVQWPYRRHLQKLRPGFVLDVGCGMGRNLFHCNGNGIGIDIDAESLASCRSHGLVVYTPDEFDREVDSNKQFDTLLFAHVLEHMTAPEGQALVDRYIPRLKPGGRAIFITPQEAGYRFNPTHIEFVDSARLAEIARHAGLNVTDEYSFPFTRSFGKFFRYNEFVVLARKSA